MKINLGCGHNHMIGFVNVDGFDICKPDVLHDLNKFPYPFNDNCADEIMASHVMEHLQDWWGAMRECTRILKPGGKLEVRVPDVSSNTAFTYRDHLHIIGLRSFDSIYDGPHVTSNAWFDQEERLPLILTGYAQVPFKQYNWLVRFPWLLEFCANHLRNFIHENRFQFEKVGTQ